MRVAIVDDSREQLELMERRLKLEGWEVLTVNQQIGATNMVRAFRPDVVLLDLDMPIRGTDLIKLMRREVPNALFVLHSAADPLKLRRSVSEAEAHLGFSKSEDMAVIVNAIRRLANEASHA